MSQAIDRIDTGRASDDVEFIPTEQDSELISRIVGELGIHAQFNELTGRIIVRADGYPAELWGLMNCNGYEQVDTLQNSRVKGFPNVSIVFDRM